MANRDLSTAPSPSRLPTTPEKDPLELFPTEQAPAAQRVVRPLKGSHSADKEAWVDTLAGYLIVAIAIGFIVATIYYLASR